VLAPVTRAVLPMSSRSMFALSALSIDDPIIATAGEARASQQTQQRGSHARGIADRSLLIQPSIGEARHLCQ
jgi:hypothetical protein